MSQRHVRYLSGTTSRQLEELARTGADVGLLIQPSTAYLAQSLRHYRWWAADNGCFRQPIDNVRAATRWLQFVGNLPRAAFARCMFCVVPDVPFDMAKSWRMSEPWLYVPRMLGMPVGLALQDGAELHEEMWARSAEWDVAFIGGTTDWKVSQAAMECCQEAGIRHKGIHVGRVNSGKRLQRAYQFGADSVDGTFLAHAGAEGGTERLARWLRADDQQELFGDPAWWVDTSV